ncbi:MAG: hypothetical protein AAGG08_01875 [Actinomycetota bacterium]
MRRSLGLLSVVPLALVACGSDADGGADVAAFCDRLGPVIGGDVDVFDDPAEGVAVLSEIREVAPEEVRGDLGTLIDVLGEVDLDDMDAAFEALFSDDVIAASESLEAYTVVNCEGGTASTARALYDEAEDGPVDPTVASRPGLAKFLDEEYANAPWKGSINGTGALFNASTLTVSGSALEPMALDVCAAMLEYAGQFEATEQVIVRNDQGDDLVTGTPTGGCVDAAG